MSAKRLEGGLRQTRAAERTDINSPSSCPLTWLADCLDAIVGGWNWRWRNGGRGERAVGRLLRRKRDGCWKDCVCRSLGGRWCRRRAGNRSKTPKGLDGYVTSGWPKLCLPYCQNGVRRNGECRVSLSTTNTVQILGLLHANMMAKITFSSPYRPISVIRHLRRAAILTVPTVPFAQYKVHVHHDCAR